MLVKYPIMGLSFARGYFAICGGGGSLKSGIKNTVDIYQLSDSDPSGFTKDISVETGTELASGVAFSHDGALIAVSVNAACWLYELDKKEKTMKLLVKFRTDFAEQESSQSCACFVGNSTILTGGEDGVVRVWRLNVNPSPEEKARGNAKSLHCPEDASHDAGGSASVTLPIVGDAVISGSTLVTLTREYRGHTKRIRAVDVDPSHRNLIVSSSEDQSCHIWRLTETTPLFKFSMNDALDTAYQSLRAKAPTGPRKHQFRCARFANSGRRLYTVLTPARGDSILIKWKPETIAQANEEQWTWVVEAAAIAGDKPVASLCVSGDDDFVCAAAVSGEIRVFRTAALQPYKKHSTEQHSFAITGMSFAFNADKNAKVFHLVSGGADKNLLRHDIAFEGGEIVSGVDVLMSALESFIGSIVRLALNSFMVTTLLFILLLFIHAKEALLMDGPFRGFEDMVALQFDSMDALAALGATLLSIVLTWLVSRSSSVTTVFFWNGVLCLFSALLVFFVAVSPDLQLHWRTGDAAFDSLLDYKISIVLGTLSIVFLFSHSVLQLVL
uniref:Uncharacterized protein n=1 Tax=Globisporangium ultimum (strain ATCC 200006 / CBS 805.95 / DAOM BR144) TaxID=431595 RepID=K3XBS9_GLOUD